MNSKDAPFPRASRVVAFVVALTAVVSLVILEYAVLPRLSMSGRVDADEWQNDVDRVNASYHLKNPGGFPFSEGDWIWHSAAYRPSIRRERPRRILVLGDSFVWGSGGIPNMNNLSWRQLERVLHRRGYLDVEVIAAGRSGASTHQAFDALPFLRDRYQPDLIAWIYVTNDPDEKAVKQFDRSVLQQDGNYKAHAYFAKRGIFPRVNRQLAALREKKLEKTMPPDKVGYEYVRWEKEILQGENLRRYERTLERLGAWRRENRVPLFFMTVPNSPDPEYFEPLYAVVEPLFRREGIPFFNIIREFAARYPNPKDEPERWRASPADGHPGHQACRFHAEKMADIIEENYSVFLGRRYRPSIPRPWINDWFPEDMEVPDRTGARLDIRYPASSAKMPRMPVGSPFVQLNFRDPVPLARIAVSGPDMKWARIFVSGEEPEKLSESGIVVGLGERAGRRTEWSLDEYPWKHCVDSIRVQAGFDGPDRNLRIDFR